MVRIYVTPRDAKAQSRILGIVTRIGYWHGGFRRVLNPPGAGTKPNTQQYPIPFCVTSIMVERTFTVRLTKDADSGYYAVRCVELPEAISQGRTEKEALANIKEAIGLVLEEYEAEAKKEGGKLIPVVV